MPHAQYPVPNTQSPIPNKRKQPVTLIYKRVCNQAIMSNSPATEPKPSYVKLAMRNMVRKGGTSIKHFGLTAIGLLAVLVGLAYLTR
ncbi:hypothetical protein NIES4103_22250 [Nostoc sp. NIES-4103]|nr:hypothetical protein NIES4103_22250 [Nostoc sp. NIES-4103]